MSQYRLFSMLAYGAAALVAMALLSSTIQAADGRRYTDTLKASRCEVIPAVTTVNVRYIVADVNAAVEFYTQKLGFQLQMQPAPGFAIVARGDLRLLLNRPGAGGAGQAMPDGQLPAPGGWNRIQIEVEDLATTVDQLKAAGAHFRNEIVVGIGGKQILLDDPSGNPIELFEPPAG